MYLMCGGSFTTLFMVMACMCTPTIAEFAEVPSNCNVTVELGTPPPPCRCRHIVLDAIISWKVNDSPLGLFPNITSGSISEKGYRVDTLTIPAKLQYNGTSVECVAVFTDGSREMSPAAIIFFTPTNSSITVQSSFDVVPSPLTVAVEQETATFQCQHSLAVGIEWLLNGTPISRAGLGLVSFIVQFNGSVATYTLSIGTLIEYNQTKIECVATFIDESTRYADAAMLFIQDTPRKIDGASCQRDYISNSLVTLWNPLFTLDINDTDPDIVYTVQLFLTTCGQHTIINQTTVAGTNSTEEDVDLMQTYTATIFARNNVPGARNGPSVEMEETFVLLNESALFHLARSSQVNIISLDPFPSFYEIILESLDGLGLDCRVNVTVHRNNDIISIVMEDVLPPKSLWNASILVYGCEAENHTTVTELSTHNLYNVAINSPLPSEIRVRGDFAERSTATGVLLIVYSNESDIHYIAQEKDQENTFDVRVNGLSGTWYSVSVFSLENQLPFPRVVASPRTVQLAAANNQGMTQQSLIEYKLQATSTSVCITCTFLDRSTTDCLVVVHQRIGSNGLMNLESSHRFNRSQTGNTAYGCIKGVNQIQHQIGVADGKMISEPSTTKEESRPVGAIAAGIVLGVIFFAVIAMIVILILMYMNKSLKRRRKLATHVPEAVESPYDVADLAPQQSGTIESAETGYSSLEPPLPPQEETQPLLTPPPIPPRVVADGVTSSEAKSATHDSQEASVHHQSISGPPPVQSSTDKNGSMGDPTYTQPVLLRSLKNTVHPPATTEKTMYDDIQGFQNPQGQQYAIPQVESTSRGEAPDDLHKVVYIEVKPHSIAESEDNNIDCTSHSAVTSAEPAAGCETLTTEQLFSFLLPHASKWLSLGKALSLDEDRLDEVFTNNETDEACLQEMLELYMMRSDLDHSWDLEVVKAALEKMESSSGVPGSVQEMSSPSNSPLVSGKTMHVPGTCATDAEVVDVEEVGIVTKELIEDSIHCVELDFEQEITGQFPRDKQPSPSEDASNPEEQGGSADSGYSQLSEPESSVNNEADSAKASLEKQSETSDKNRPATYLNISPLEHLADYELDSSLGSEAEPADGCNSDGEFGRVTNEGLPMSVPCTSTHLCSSAGQSCLQVEGFHEKPGDQCNDDDLCKISSMPAQDSHIHKNYKEALMHQMGLQKGQRIREKLECNNAVEESSLVHADNEHFDQLSQKQFATLFSSKSYVIVRVRVRCIISVD